MAEVLMVTCNTCGKKWDMDHDPALCDCDPEVEDWVLDVVDR